MNIPSHPDTERGYQLIEAVHHGDRASWRQFLVLRKKAGPTAADLTLAIAAKWAENHREVPRNIEDVHVYRSAIQARASASASAPESTAAPEPALSAQEEMARTLAITQADLSKVETELRGVKAQRTRAQNELAQLQAALNDVLAGKPVTGPPLAVRVQERLAPPKGEG